VLSAVLRQGAHDVGAQFVTIWMYRRTHSSRNLTLIPDFEISSRFSGLLKT
jgi:hypothetical protein